MFSFALLLSGCINNGIEWSELSFTRTKPNPSDLVGIWAPTDATIKDMKEQGAYTISIHQPAASSGLSKPESAAS